MKPKVIVFCFDYLQFVHNDQVILLRTIPTPVQQIVSVDDERVNIIRSGNSLTANIKGLNIQITAIWHPRHRFINYRVFVPRFLCEISFGHLGNCDGNRNNDVSRRDDREYNLDSLVFLYVDNQHGRRHPFLLLYLANTKQ